MPSFARTPAILSSSLLFLSSTSPFNLLSPTSNLVVQKHNHQWQFPLNNTHLTDSSTI